MLGKHTMHEILFEIDASNVIYIVYDDTDCLYVGKTKSLGDRFIDGNWSHVFTLNGNLYGKTELGKAIVFFYPASKLWTVELYGSIDCLADVQKYVHKNIDRPTFEEAEQAMILKLHPRLNYIYNTKHYRPFLEIGALQDDSDTAIDYIKLTR